ncbi:MAG: hypothetical protein ACREFR_15325, partial [Limisphaerales bacterium]
TLAMAPGWVRRLKPVWIFNHRLRRVTAGHFRVQPMSYEMYTLESPGRRVRFEVSKPTSVWWNRM